MDSMKSTPTPISRIPAAAKRTMHQLFVITPNTRSREQIRLCEEKGIYNIISHAEHTSNHNRNTTAVEPTPRRPTLTPSDNDDDDIDYDDDIPGDVDIGVFKLLPSLPLPACPAGAGLSGAGPSGETSEVTNSNR
ncbi:hypothetical protein QJQ45_025243 [Haematococcus lacustris]|nr:hypothetical protein QJQ45_025243 [Haematococcus lacustris]